MKCLFADICIILSIMMKRFIRQGLTAILLLLFSSENVAIAEAPAMNLDIFSHHPTSRGAQDYLALMGELRAARFI